MRYLPFFLNKNKDTRNVEWSRLWRFLLVRAGSTMRGAASARSPSYVNQLFVFCMYSMDIDCGIIFYHSCCESCFPYKNVFFFCRLGHNSVIKLGCRHEMLMLLCELFGNRNIHPKRELDWLYSSDPLLSTIHCTILFKALMCCWEYRVSFYQRFYFLHF